MIADPATLEIAAAAARSLPGVLDALIVGGGPAGTAAAFRARELGLRVLVIEFDDVLKRIRDYPKDKLILPDFGGGDRMCFPLAGDCIAGLVFEPIDKDDMCAGWKRLYDSWEIPLLLGVELTGLERASHGWDARTWNHRTREPGLLKAKHVVLAIGRGVPRRFDIPGNTDGIAYRMDDPARYAAGPTCVIGGGTSAAEAVISISKAKIAAGDESQVFWSYRGSRMPRVSKALADEFFEAYIGNGNIRYQPNSEPVAIVTSPEREEFLSLRVDRKTLSGRPPETVHLEFPKSNCIACIGEDVPETFLRDLGVQLVPAGKDKKMCVVTSLLETQQPNVYLIGDLLSQAYLETDSFDSPPDAYRQVKHRGNIKSSLRDGVFIAEVIRQRLDGCARIEVVIRDAQPAAAEPQDRTVARVSAALGLTPALQEAAAESALPSEPEQQAWLVSITPTGVEAEQYALRANGAVTIGRTGCDIRFEQDTALSDSHASVSCRNGEYYLRDDGSRSGTYYRVRPEAPIAVPAGTLIRAGRQMLVAGSDGERMHLDHYDPAGRPVRRHPMQAKAMVFGRSAGPSHPDVALDNADMTLSRFHLSAAALNGAILIQDFGSRNGTYLKVDTEHRLEHEDIFRVGNQQFQVRLREDLPVKTGSQPVGPPPATAAAEPTPPQPVAAGAKAHITFADQDIAGDADPAETLLEWADARDVEIDNECWIGMCGCDVIRVIEGGQFLSNVTEKEKKTLERKGLEPGPFRLACVVRCSGPVVVRVAD